MSAAPTPTITAGWMVRVATGVTVERTTIDEESAVASLSATSGVVTVVAGTEKP